MLLKICRSNIGLQIFLPLITEAELEKFKVEIDANLKRGHETKQITDDEYAAMKTKSKGAGKIYHLFKVHKEHQPPNLPPGRPIVSGCNSITENISKFVDFHAKKLVPKFSLKKITP